MTVLEGPGRLLIAGLVCLSLGGLLFTAGGLAYAVRSVRSWRHARNECP
ncbi:hypothetical protein [Streptomyces prunicolor]